MSLAGEAPPGLVNAAMDLFQQLRHLFEQPRSCVEACRVELLLADEAVRREGKDEDAAQCPICLQAVESAVELASFACGCETLYHCDCLTGVMKCPTCRKSCKWANVSMELHQLRQRLRGRRCEAGLTLCKEMEPQTLMLLVDDVESSLRSEVVRLREESYAKQIEEQRGRRHWIEVRHGEVEGLSTPQLSALLRLAAHRGAPFKLEQLGCALCTLPFARFSDICSQGCLSCGADTSTQAFYHAGCLAAEALRRRQAQVCHRCHCGKVERQPFRVKDRLQQLRAALLCPTSVDAVKEATAREWCALEEERSHLRGCDSAPERRRSRSPPPRIPLPPILLRGRIRRECDSTAAHPPR